MGEPQSQSYFWKLEYFWLHFDVFLFIVQNGNAAASLSVAEQYVSAFSNLAKESNTILLPSNTGDISGMVTQVCICLYIHVPSKASLQNC